jgi:REP-associated tyrosine transposase
MPRAPRLDFPGALHHVIVRGIERRKIFHGDADRRAFLSRLAALIPASGATLYAWALMPNHAHVLLRSGARGLSNLMQRFLGGYATTFNRGHQRTGYLFQNRFKSTLVDEEAYLLTLVRYIHLNPVRSRLPVTLDSLDRYPWTGHAVLLGHTQYAAQDCAFVLQHFGRRVGEARRAYRQFVRQPVAEGQPDDLDGGGLQRSAGAWQQLSHLARGREQWTFDERVLGSSEFVQRVLQRCELVSRLRPRVDPDAILTALCSRAATRCRVSEEEIASRTVRRRALSARAMIGWVAVRHYGLTLSAVARHLHVSIKSISRAIERGQDLRTRDPDWLDEF